MIDIRKHIIYAPEVDSTATIEDGKGYIVSLVAVISELLSDHPMSIPEAVEIALNNSEDLPFLVTNLNGTPLYDTLQSYRKWYKNNCPEIGRLMDEDEEEEEEEDEDIIDGEEIAEEEEDV